MNRLAFLISLVSLLFFGGRLGWGEAPATMGAMVSSKPVTKDGLQVTVKMAKTVFAADEPLKFTVEFKNVTEKTLALSDVDWFWNWKILFEDEARKGPWRLENVVMVKRSPTEHVCAAGEAYEVVVDLGKRALPHQFVWEGDQAKSVKPIEKLQVGKYRLRIDMELTTGDSRADVGYWAGMISTDPITIEIVDKAATRP